MKPKYLIFALMPAFFNGSSCSKYSTESIDCIQEGKKVTIQSSVVPSEPRKIFFEARYSGEFNITSVTWEYGDGSSETVNGLPVTHTYTIAGTYNVKARVTITGSGYDCTSETTSTVTVH